MDKSKSDKTGELNLLSMIESRIMEIVHIENECKKKLPKLYSQRLPRFMRRRAACHNPERLPKKLRPPGNSEYGSKCRKSLMKYRHRLRFRKHKRVLRKHASAKYDDPHKCLLHKWFAKRFKIGSLNESLKYIPLRNNTKNQRNLYRQTRYGCAYYPLVHLMPIQLNLSTISWQLDKQLLQVNQLADEVAGFTFCAQAMRQGRYEVSVKLLNLDAQTREHLCTGLSSFSRSQESSKNNVPDLLTLWIPRGEYDKVYKYLEKISTMCDPTFTLTRIYPRDWTRVRLVGPSAYEDALKIADDKDVHQKAIEDANFRLSPKLGSLIGRCIEEKFASFVYYNTRPQKVDIVLKTAGGRMLWHKLVKNKAHLVGGYHNNPSSPSTLS